MKYIDIGINSLLKTLNGCKFENYNVENIEMSMTVFFCGGPINLYLFRNSN
jgi:hypothetical protein